MNDLYLNNIDLNNIDLSDIEKLSAYIDNELSPKDRSELEQRLAVESELLQALAKLERGNNIAQTFFSELDNKPLPMNLEAMILNAKPSESDCEKLQPVSQVHHKSESQSATIVDIFRNKKNTFITQGWGLASAASMVLALGVWMLMPPTQLKNDASLLAVLNTEPSGSITTVNPELKIELLASYQNRQGTVCRSLIEHTPTSSNSAQACLIQGKWQIDKEDLSKEYKTASSLTVITPGNIMTEDKEREWLSR